MIGWGDEWTTVVDLAAMMVMGVETAVVARTAKTAMAKMAMAKMVMVKKAMAEMAMVKMVMLKMAMSAEMVYVAKMAEMLRIAGWRWPHPVAVSHY